MPGCAPSGSPLFIGLDLYDAAVVLADAIAKAEVAVVAAELADPSTLVIVAEAEGVTAATFSHEDLRIIHCAAAVARHLQLVNVLKLARQALRDARYWNPQGPFGTGSQWSDETLAQLARSYPACVPAVRAYSRHLVALNRRWRIAEDLLAQFRAVLTGDADAPLPPGTDAGVTPRPRFVLMPGKRGVA
jgi:hypothetical protein